VICIASLTMRSRTICPGLTQDPPRRKIAQAFKLHEFTKTTLLQVCRLWTGWSVTYSA